MQTKKQNWDDAKQLEGKGVGIGKAHSFEEEKSSMIHEQLARLKFVESKIDMKSKTILDFGCGTGYNSYYISEKQHPEKVVGIDILNECIDYCKKNYSTDRTEYLVQDCLIHKPSLGLFDVAICSEVLEHVHEQDLFLDTCVKYLKPSGQAFISTPNKGLFSLSKNKSFLNNTHVKELYFDEFQKLIDKRFKDYKIYSQIHTPEWHEIYINYASAANLIQTFRYDVFGDNIFGRLASRAARHLLFPVLFKTRSSGYKDVRERRYTDFEFKEGYDNHAMWFIAIGKPKENS